MSYLVTRSKKTLLLLILFLFTAGISVKAQLVCNGSPISLFKEDFGDAGTTTATYIGTPAFQPGGSTEYTLVGTYGSGSPANDHAIIGNTTKATPAFGAWIKGLKDHTNNSTGNMFIINCNSLGTNLYKAHLDNLCPGKKLFFSFWAINLIDKGTAGKARPQTSIIVKNGSTTIASTTTATVPNDNAWHQYYITVVVPAGVTSLDFLIDNAQTNTDGNDVAIDDISIMMCNPIVSVTAVANKTQYNVGETINLTATVTDDNGTFAAGYSYQWYYSTDNQATWQRNPITSSDTEKTNQLSMTAAMPSVGNTIYYKIAVANKGDLVDGVLPAGGKCDGVLATFQVDIVGASYKSIISNGFLQRR